MLSFYRQLGFAVHGFEEDGLQYYAVHFGDQRFNFHHSQTWQSDSLKLRGPNAVPGCGDFCFVWDASLESLLALLRDLRLEIELGPVPMTGGRARGRLEGQSVYIRDPDANLLEFIVYP